MDHLDELSILDNSINTDRKKVRQKRREKSKKKYDDNYEYDKKSSKNLKTQDFQVSMHEKPDKKNNEYAEETEVRAGDGSRLVKKTENETKLANPQKVTKDKQSLSKKNKKEKSKSLDSEEDGNADKFPIVKKKKEKKN